jgi:plastocyanin
MGLVLGLAAFLMAAPAAVATDHRVVVTNDVFVPAEIFISTGDTIDWRNLQGFHSTTSDDGLWDFGAAGNPWGFNFTFTQPGDYFYHCKIHVSLGMVGVVHVVDPGD